MTRITIKLTAQELDLLARLASDQLFRLEFIDPKMPGYRQNLEEVRLGKAIVARLQLIGERVVSKRAPQLKLKRASV